MKILALAFAGALAFTSVEAAAVPAMADSYGRHHDRGSSCWRDGRYHHDCGRHRGYRNGRYYHANRHQVRVCKTTWRHHHRVRTCRMVWRTW